MSMDRYTDRLGDYIDGTLSDRDRQLLETHLAACEACRTEVEELARIREAARALPRLNPPEYLWKKIEASLRAREPSLRPTINVVELVEQLGHGGNGFAAHRLGRSPTLVGALFTRADSR